MGCTVPLAANGHQRCPFSQLTIRASRCMAAARFVGEGDPLFYLLRRTCHRLVAMSLQEVAS